MNENRVLVAFKMPIGSEPGSYVEMEDGKIILPMDKTPRELCMDLLNAIIPKTEDNNIFDNRIIINQDYYCFQVYAYIINYDYDLFARVVGSSEGREKIAQKGLVELSLIAGSMGWKAEMLLG